VGYAMGHDLTTVLLALLGLFVALQIVVRVAKRLVHIPAPAYADVFLDSPFRRLWQPPAKIIERSGIAPGMTVLEIGCGGGAIARHVARALGPEGRLVALDVQAKMLARFRRKLDRPANRDIGNVTLVQADARELPFDDETFDLVYAVTALPEVPDRPRALAEVKRVLRPGGVLAVTELIVDPDYPLRRTTIRLCTEAGLALDS
ncbi:unnamed protein product, partial [marine sediment metagenome]